MVLHQDTTGELSLCNKPRNFLVDEKQEPGVAALRREILAVAQIPTLLKENPTLAKSLERRNPYLDPLNHIQVALIPRYRRAVREHGADSPETEMWLRPLLRSINALAAGMRNTG